MYEVLLEPRAERDLDRLKGERIHERLIDALQRLEGNPRPVGVKKLGDDIYRMRVGSFRIIYVVSDTEKVILVSAVRRRTETTYRDL